MVEFIEGHSDDPNKAINLSKTGYDIHHMLKSIRRQRFPEIHIGMTDDLVSMPSFRPPREAEQLFNEIFSEEQRRHVKLMLHPLLKRLCIVEKRQRKGQPLWTLVTMFHDAPTEGILPADVQRHDKATEHWRGKLGPFKQPSRKELEVVEKCDLWKYGWEQVEEYLYSFIEEEEQEKEKAFDDYVDGFLDYNFWLAMRDAQEHYSQPWSVDTVNLKSDPSRWKVTQKNGYTVRERVYGEEGDLNEALVEFNKHKTQKESLEPMKTPVADARLRIMAIKNEKWRAKYGESLWERVTGNKVIWPDLPEEKKEENHRQAKELVEMVESVPEDTAGESIESWLLQQHSRRQQQSQSSKQESETPLETQTETVILMPK